MFETITRIFPKIITEHYNKLFIYSRVKVNKESFLGFFLVVSFAISLIISISLKILFNVNFLFAFVIAFIVLQLISYFSFLLKADANAKFVENLLPDVLHLMSSNLRAGLTIDKALLLSSRPEFGILSEEINNVGKKLALGEDIGNALMDMGKNIKSEQLNKTLMLISTGLRSGGELVDLLDHVSRNLRQKMFLDEKIKTNILMYVIFIFAAISVGAPVLFGFSSFLVNVIEKNLASVDLPDTTFIPISFSKINIQSSFIINFSIISLITTSILGSLVLGLINNGHEKAGVKYIPILITVTILIFFLSRFLVSSLLGGLFGL